MQKATKLILNQSAHIFFQNEKLLNSIKFKAYYFLKETYVDKLEKKAEEGLDVEKGYLKAKSPSMQRRKSLNNQNNNTLNTGPKVTTRRKSLVGAAAAELKSPNSQRRRKSISLRDD